jgi:restriction endonuclease Mrr
LEASDEAARINTDETNEKNEEDVVITLLMQAMAKVKAALYQENFSNVAVANPKFLEDKFLEEV